MIDDGLLDRFSIEAMYGLHNMPGIPAGHLHTRSGTIMAGEDNFTIDIFGRGGHAARPHMVIDPLVIASQIIMALQTIVARSLDPLESAVVSCTEITTDGARNAIPGWVRITGDTRSADPHVQALLEDRIRSVATGIATASSAAAEVAYTHEFRPTINCAPAVGTAVAAANQAVGEAHVDPQCAPVMASEDFGIYAEQVPACFLLIGNGTEPGRGGDPLHSSSYQFNDDVLGTGIAFYDTLVHHHLGEHT